MVVIILILVFSIVLIHSVNYVYYCLDSVIKENGDKTTCSICQKVSQHLRLPRNVRLENETTIIRRLANIQCEQSCGSCDSKEQAEAFCHQCDTSVFRFVLNLIKSFVVFVITK